MPSLDDWIDRVAFGKAPSKPGPALGLYLSPEMIYVCQARLDAGAVAVEHLLRVPLPAADKPLSSAATGTLSAETLGEEGRLFAALKQSLSQVRWSSKRVFVTLSHQLGLLRYFTMPSIASRFWSAAVLLEAKKYIPIPLDSLSHDFQVASLPPDVQDRPRQGALVAVAQRKTVLSVTSLLDKLGLTLLGLEVAPCSVLRLLETLDPGRSGSAYGQVHFDGGNIRILLADRGLPIFFRELFLGAEASLSDQRKIDLSGCVRFAQKQLSSRVQSQLLLSGNAPDLKQWSDAFSSELGMPAQAQDLPRRLGVKACDWGGYAAIGASLRLSTPSAITLDLGRIGRVGEDERRAARDLLAVSSAIALFLSLLGAWRFLDCRSLERRLRREQIPPMAAAAFQGKSQTQIAALLDKMGGQAQAASLALRHAPKTTALIQDIVKAMPDNLWLTELKVNSPLRRQDMMEDSPEIILSGRAQGPSVAAEQDMAFAFRQQLLKTPELAKTFGDVQIALSGKAVDAKQQGVAPDILRRRLEERTSFQVTMKEKGQ